MLDNAVAVAALPDVELDVVALPLKDAVIVPAEKLPEASLKTIVEPVLGVAAVMVALFAWLVIVPAVVADVAVVALPDNAAVIVPAEKLPEASRATIAEAVLRLVAVVFAFATLNVPPNVKLPEVVTVPLRLNPLTVPVPATDVTVPVFVV